MNSPDQLFGFKQEIDAWSDVFLFDILSAPLARFLGKIDLDPFIITFLSLATGVSSALTMLLGLPHLAALLYFLSVLLDSLDGKLARLSGRESMVRRLVDQISDQVVFALLIISIIFKRSEHGMLFSVIIILILLYEVSLVLRLDMAPLLREDSMSKRIEGYSALLDHKGFIGRLLRIHDGLLNITTRFRTWPYPKLADLHVLLIIYLLIPNPVLPYLMILSICPDLIISLFLAVAVARRRDHERAQRARV
jgi:phosphatidylglycerophosphate synthase